MNIVLKVAVVLLLALIVFCRGWVLASDLSTEHYVARPPRLVLVVDLVSTIGAVGLLVYWAVTA